MLITIFGFLWIIIYFMCGLFGDLRHLFIFLFLSMTLQCNNIIIFNGTGIGPQVLGSICFVLMAFLKKPNDFSKIKKSYLYSISICFLMIMIVYFKTDSFQLLRAFQLFAYIGCFIVIGNIADCISEDKIYNCMQIVTIFILIIGGIQFVMCIGLVPKLSLFKQLFFNDNSGAIAFNLNVRYNRMTSVFQEPSYYGCFLSAVFYYFLCNSARLKKNLILLFAIFVEIILTFSSTAYCAFAITGIVFVLLSNDTKLKNRIIPIALIGIVFFYFFSYQTLDAVIFSKKNSGSAAVRNQWNTYAYKMFLRSPIFGNGYKSTRASSLLITILSELGIVGLFCFLLILFNLFFEIINGHLFCRLKKESFELFALIAVITGQIIACPDLDFCVLWLFMYIANYYKEKRIYKKDTCNLEKV